MYSTYKEDKSLVVESFVRTLKGKLYKKMMRRHNRSYLEYLLNLVDECNKRYHRAFVKKTYLC